MKKTTRTVGRQYSRREETLITINLDKENVSDAFHDLQKSAANQRPFRERIKHSVRWAKKTLKDSGLPTDTVVNYVLKKGFKQDSLEDLAARILTMARTDFRVCELSYELGRLVTLAHVYKKDIERAKKPKPKKKPWAVVLAKEHTDGKPKSGFIRRVLRNATPDEPKILLVSGVAWKIYLDGKIIEAKNDKTGKTQKMTAESFRIHYL